MFFAKTNLAGTLLVAALLMKKSDSMYSQRILKDVRALIVEAQRQTTVVNVGLTVLYWKIGKRITEGILGKERCAYDEQIVAMLEGQLRA